MRAMTEEEIDKLAAGSKWATIITIRPDGSPHAIEATPFMMDGDVGFMINPAGATRKNTDADPRVLLKYTLAENGLKTWAGASIRGEGSFEKDPARIARGWRLLGELLGEDYSEASKKFVKTPGRSPLFVVKVTEKTGRCSARAGEEFAAGGAS